MLMHYGRIGEREALPRADREAMLRADLRIHRIMVEAGGNRTLATVHEALAVKVERARFLASTSVERLSQSLREHEAIMAAIRARDADRIAESLHEHCLRTRDAVVAAVLAQTAEDRTRKAA
jgi:DNA-binding GntR family transcriptional regulator